MLMDSFIKKIFDGKIDDSVHVQFQKFSRGEFRNKALVKAGMSKGIFSIATTYEYAQDFVKGLAEKMADGQKTKVTGVIVSTRDLKSEIKFKSIKQFMGIKQYVIDEDMSKEQILDLCKKLPNSFLGLSFSVSGSSLKIKPKAPKSAKSSSSGDKAPNPDFCKLKTDDAELAKSVLFGIENFKKVEIAHDFIIQEIITPRGENDPAKMREMAVRKGKIIRKINADGDEKIQERAFEA